ncbi:CCGSCS motif protein [Thalassotalea piscium]|uniref:CCGSCS motif protein n=1 Tax=Thalassotalea piscium TaxID=1230533 RepID=A0A7X0TUD0_9GAMM|nr:CCGSCS motif protein [Thalassotalea piscium]MBB6544232.1 CCGSCS motif protein [Thalassotalea piscium]
MFSFLNPTKTKKELAPEQFTPSDAEHKQAVEQKVEKEKPVHGEDGVCCGGCGGQ